MNPTSDLPTIEPVAATGRRPAAPILRIRPGRRRPLVLSTLGAGGYGFQASQLIGRLSQKCDMIYMTTTFGHSPQTKNLPEGPFFRVPYFATMTKNRTLDTMLSFAVATWRSLRFIRRHKPDLVVGVAMPQSTALLLAARLLACETVFVESITRTTKPSNTAVICHRFRLARFLFVQWPELKERLPRAIYAGKIL
jgi:beta-1,4-N-acetylglucosaminyltransferase